MLSSGIPAFSSHMGTACAFCRGLGELTYIWANGATSLTCRYMLARYIHWPIDFTLSFTASYFLFDFDPGWASPLLFTASYAIGLSIARGVVDRRSRVVESFVVAAAAHLVPVLNVFGQIVPTRLLRSSDNQPLTTLVVGVGFPLLGFVLRKFVMKAAWAYARKESDRKDSADSDNPLIRFSKLVTMVSTTLLVTPAVLCYIGAKSIKQGWGIALLGVATEISVKLFVMFNLRISVKKFTLKRRIRIKVISMRRPSEKSKNSELKNSMLVALNQINKMEEEEKEEQEFIKEQERQLRRATRVLSYQWSEEVSIEHEAREQLKEKEKELTK